MTTYSPYSPYGAKRSGNKQRAKVAALVGVPIVALGLGSIVMGAYMKERRPIGYCYTQDKQHQVAVFLDSSFAAQSSSTQYRDYRTAFMRAYDNAPPNAAISLFTTLKDKRGSFVDPAFTICKPAETPDEQTSIGAPSKPGAFLKNKAAEARQEYLEEVESILADAQDPEKNAGDSPVLEQLQAISRFEGFQGANRSLTAITDGIQNSEIARFCIVRGDMPSFSDFEKSSRYEHVRPNGFDGVNVTFLLVEFGKLPAPGLNYCTNDEVRAWWPEYFKANGVASVEPTRLRYWAGE